VDKCEEQWELVEAGTPRDIEQPSMPVWYFCDASQDYFPYVAQCSGEWVKVPAIPPPEPGE
jgi:hypothetical protein